MACDREEVATERKSAAKFSSYTVTVDGLGSVRSSCCSDVCSAAGGLVLCCRSAAWILSDGVIGLDRSIVDEKLWGSALKTRFAFLPTAQLCLARVGLTEHRGNL